MDVNGFFSSLEQQLVTTVEYEGTNLYVVGTLDKHPKGRTWLIPESLVRRGYEVIEQIKPLVGDVKVSVEGPFDTNYCSRLGYHGNAVMWLDIQPLVYSKNGGGLFNPEDFTEKVREYPDKIEVKEMTIPNPHIFVTDGKVMGNVDVNSSIDYHRIEYAQFSQPILKHVILDKGTQLTSTILRIIQPKEYEEMGRTPFTLTPHDRPENTEINVDDVIKLLSSRERKEIELNDLCDLLISKHAESKTVRYVIALALKRGKEEYDPSSIIEDVVDVEFGETKKGEFKHTFPGTEKLFCDYRFIPPYIGSGISDDDLHIEVRLGFQDKKGYLIDGRHVNINHSISGYEGLNYHFEEHDIRYRTNVNFSDRSIGYDEPFFDFTGSIKPSGMSLFVLDFENNPLTVLKVLKEMIMEDVNVRIEKYNEVLAQLKKGRESKKK